MNKICLNQHTHTHTHTHPLVMKHTTLTVNFYPSELMLFCENSIPSLLAGFTLCGVSGLAPCTLDNCVACFAHVLLWLILLPLLRQHEEYADTNTIHTRMLTTPQCIHTHPLHTHTHTNALSLEELIMGMRCVCTCVRVCVGATLVMLAHTITLT